MGERYGSNPGEECWNHLAAMVMRDDCVFVTLKSFADGFDMASEQIKVVKDGFKSLTLINQGNFIYGGGKAVKEHKSESFSFKHFTVQFAYQEEKSLDM